MADGMPKSYDDWRTQGPPETEHFKACPCGDDADPICECGCLYDSHLAENVCHNEKECLCEGWKADDDPDCICADLDEDAKESAAEARQALEDEGY